MMADKSIWLVGCGNMGGAMLRGWLSHGVDASSVLVIDPLASDLPEGVERVDAAPAGAAPQLLLLAIKPQMLEDVAPDLAIGPNTLVISILAGVETASLARHLAGAAAYVRVMPNMPAAIGEGVSAVYAATLDTERREQVESLVSPLGAVEWVDDEDLFHAITGLSGSGPAFVFRFIDAMAAAGVGEGISADLAMRLAVATVAGSARLALTTGKPPRDLAEAVRSPNGTTHAGLVAMDASEFTNIVRDTVSAAAKRSRELAAEAARR